jgi:hypothetical protein
VRGHVRSRSFGVALVIVTLSLLAACSSDEPPPPVHSPTPFFSSPGPTGATSQSGPTGLTSTSGPSGTTGGGGPTGGQPGTGSTGRQGVGGNGRRGTLSVHVSGGIQVSRTLRDLVTATYSPPGGAIAIVWTAGGTDPSTVSIGGLSFVGSRPTATTLTMTMTVPSSSTGFETFVSLAGECRITLARSSSSGAAGSFRCSNLKSTTGVTVNATGTFSASG